MTDVLTILYTYDRSELLEQSLETMFKDPGMEFRLWVVDNGSYFSSLYGKNSGEKQLNFLLDYYKKGRIEELILNNKNLGINHALNQLMAHAKLTSNDPKISTPEFVFTTNDDMIYESNWLRVCYDTLLALENDEKVRIVSPFHCYHSNGNLAYGMETIKTVSHSGQNYEIKRNLSGNSWFMRGETWLHLFDWYPTHHPTEGGDWNKLDILNKNNFRCAITPTELVHHAPESQGTGKFNRLGHW